LAPVFFVVYEKITQDEPIKKSQRSLAEWWDQDIHSKGIENFY